MRQRALPWLLVAALCGCDDPVAPPPTAPSSVPAPSLSTGGAPAASSSTAPPPASGSAAIDGPALPSSEPAPSAAPPAPTSTATASPTTKPSATAAPSTPTTTPSGAAPSATATASATPVPTATAAPAAGSAEAVAAAIDALYVPRPRYQARFVQKHKQKVAGVEKESRGTVFVERPNKISFRYDPPNKNRIVSDGTTLKVYVADDGQMFEQPVKNTEYPGALSFIMGTGLRSSFTFSFHDKAKFALGHVLVGKPTAATPHYDSVLFYVDQKKLDASDAGAMNGVLILDPQGNRNRFEFFDPKFPATIDAAEFAFTPPPGTNVTR